MLPSRSCAGLPACGDGDVPSDRDEGDVQAVVAEHVRRHRKLTELTARERHVLGLIARGRSNALAPATMLPVSSCSGP